MTAERHSKPGRLSHGDRTRALLALRRRAATAGGLTLLGFLASALAQSAADQPAAQSCGMRTERQSLPSGNSSSYASWSLSMTKPPCGVLLLTPAWSERILPRRA